MHYLVIERFRDGNGVRVYQRFREQGRLAPEGLEYVTSWVSEDLATCWQVMACADRALLEAWMRRWEDLVEFEVHPVLSSADALEKVERKPPAD